MRLAPIVDSWAMGRYSFTMPTESRYTRTAVLLHWLVAAIILLQFPLGWWMQEIPKQPPGPRVTAFNLHKSIGLLILALMLVRMAWRLGHAPPPLPAMPPWQRRVARANHWLLYAVLVALPLTGYLGSAFSGYPVRFFGMTLPAWASKDAELKDWMSGAHLVLVWTLTLAFAAHMAGVAQHLLVNRDGLLRRMVWRRGGEPPAPTPPTSRGSTPSSRSPAARDRSR
jgi:cytochrome b561